MGFSLKEIREQYLDDCGGVGTPPHKKASARKNARKMGQKTMKPKRIYPRILVWRADDPA